MNTNGKLPHTNLKKTQLSGTFLIIFFSISWFLCHGFSASYGQNLMPGEKIVEKGAECELDMQELIVKDKNNAVLRVHRIFNIYNQKGKVWGRVRIPTNKFMRAENIKAQVKGFDGRLIKKLEKDDINEVSLFDDYALYRDSREKYFDIGATTFPYTLEYSFEVKYKSLFFWPDWNPQWPIPVKRSEYRLTIPKDFSFKMYKHNLEIEPLDTHRKGKRQLIFELRDLQPFEPEMDMPPEENYLMALFFAPDKFDLDGHKGSTSSWEAFGEWYASLAGPQYSLSAESRALVEKLAENSPSAKTTVKTLYQFLQKKTRYVAIELDIGGYRPRDAESILTTGYGDCKDLTTLLIAMLNVAGIKAYPALLLTRDEGMVLPDLPSSQFNHVIACVPLEKDTLWLDCTCDHCPFAELPSQDEGCQALVVEKGTAKLITTPISSPEENRVIKTTHARVEPDGSLDIRGTIAANGNCESFYRQILSSMTTQEKKEWLGRYIGVHAPNHTLLSCDFGTVPKLDVPLTVSFTAKFVKYAMTSEDELLMNLNILTRIDTESIPKEKERIYPVDNQFAVTQEDEVILEIPENSEIKALPSEQDIVFPFGSFRTLYTLNQNQLVYRRTKTINQSLIEPRYYEEYRAFLTTIYTADHSFIVLRRTE